MVPWSQTFFLVFIVLVGAAREPRSGEHESREKPLVTLDLNLTFVQTPGSGSDPRARIGWYFYKHANKFDWSVWLAIPRGRWGYLLLLLMCVYLYQRKNLLAVLSLYKRSRFVCVSSTLILFRTVPSKEFDLSTRGAFSIDWKSQRTSKSCSQS